MDADARRLLKERFTFYSMALAIVASVTSQMAEGTDYNKLLSGISIGAYMVNFVAAMWAVTPTRVIEDNSWKFLVFKPVFYITGILSPYAAVSILLPKKFAWYLFTLFAMTCLIITLFNFYDMLKSSLTLLCERVVVATRWMLSNMTPPDDQVLPITHVAPAPEYHYATACLAAAEQNLGGGSGSSPNLQWYSATGHASQEQPDLNEFTNIPL